MSSGSLTIRPATSADFDDWAPLFAEYRAFYKLAPDDSVVRLVWQWITDESHEVNAVVASVGGEVVGFAHYRRFARPSRGSTGIYLDDLFTAPDSRGHGVGLALLRELSQIAEREGASVVRWMTAEDNAPARRLYDFAAASTTWVTYDLAPAPHPEPLA
jgi:GNAT superfamily N-acetyltransferase